MWPSKYVQHEKKSCCCHPEETQHVSIGLHGVTMGWDITVGIETYYKLDSLGFELQWGQEIFSSLHLAQLALRPPSPLRYEYQISFMGRTVTGAWH